mgnify:FL=1|tara:strand:- start:79 stop:471 length:393 start_codon:yes stop_codon:yes gene_type:complete
MKMPNPIENNVKFKLLLLFSIFFISCYNIATLSIASTENVDFNAKYKNIGLVEGSQRIPWIFFFPLRNPRNIDRAIELTLNENNINYLTNLRIDESFVHFYLFGYTTITVKGAGWRKIEPKFDPLTGEPL